MNKKDDGSAIILALLLLSFFMALSLNMFFISGNKAEIANEKRKGVTVSSNIEGGSFLGFYEFSIASRAFSEGFVANPNITYEAKFIDPNGKLTTETAIAGVKLASKTDFFSSFIDTSNPTQSAIKLSEYTGNETTPSAWDWNTEFSPSKKNWTELTEIRSYGRYIVSSVVSASTGASFTIGSVPTGVAIEVKQEKYIVILGDININIGNLKYQIECKENYSQNEKKDSLSEIIVNYIE